MATIRSMSSGGAGGLSGASPRGYNSASGGIPGVTSPIDAITGNLGGLSGIINSITGSQSGALRGQYPDQYFSTLGTLLGNTARRAAGDISDLLPELQQTAAERAVYGGLSGSEAENTKLLRDLGLTRYGVENEAINALGKLQGEIPTVHPFDPSGMIAAQIAAQERADMYAAAPVPEDAYQRALAAAGGGGGRNTPGLTYNLGGGGSTRPVDTVMRGYAPSIPQWGTNPYASLVDTYAPWGTFQNAISGYTGDSREGPSSVSDWTQWFDQPATGQDFGGSLDFGGGESWAGLNTDLFGAPGTDMTGSYDYLPSDYELAGGDFYEDY